MFAKRFRELRLEQGMRQSDVAEKLGFRQVTISHWEVGRKEPSIDTLIKIANLFDVSIDYLCAHTDDIFFCETGLDSVSHTSDNTNKLHSRIFSLLKQLPKPQQNRVLGYVQALLEDTERL